jgi:hypothetical protein
VVPVLAHGQDDCMENKNMRLHNNSYQCRWLFFTLKDSVDGVVVKHEKQSVPCGASATASVTIVYIGADTLRILDLCNESNYKRGQKIRILPEQVPRYVVDIPFYYDVIDEKRNQYFSRTNEYDERVLKTTWGEIRKL